MLRQTDRKTESGRNYRFSQSEVNTIHLHQGRGLHGGFLPDLSLHIRGDMSGPYHLVAHGLAGGHPAEGAPQVDAVADQLGGDDGSGGQGWYVC